MKRAVWWTLIKNAFPLQRTWHQENKASFVETMIWFEENHPNCFLCLRIPQTFSSPKLQAAQSLYHYYLQLHDEC